MHYLIGIVAAVIIVWVGVFAYNESAGDRRIKEARAYAIETQADADASATRWMAMAPVLMIVGGTIVGVVWGIGFITYAKRPLPEKPQPIYIEGPKYHQLPAPQQPNFDFYNALSGPSYEIIEAPRQVRALTRTE